MMWRLCLALLLTGFSVPGMVADHGVILLYHHVATDTPPSTSVSPDRFEEQLDFLQREGYVVLPLHDLLDGLYRDGPAIPDKAVAITFDDAYQSVIDTAYPMLARRDMPFTVFVATDAIDQGYAGYMGWEDLRKLHASALGDLGAHSVSHGHLLQGSADPDQRDRWVAGARREIDDSVSRLQAQVPGLAVRSFAYPFGEWHPPLASLVRERGLYGLAQHSGAVGAGVPDTAIPRFPISSGYADMQRLRNALQSRPLPVTTIDSGPVFISGGQPAPEQLSFQLQAGEFDRAALACYAASGDRLSLTHKDDRVQVALPALQAGRNKVNCTAPSTAHRGEFYWFSRQWVVADDAGRWLQR